MPVADVPMGDVDRIWNSLEDKSWAGLNEMLRDHREMAEGIEDSLVNMIIEESSQLDQSGEEFPHSAPELRDVLNNRLNLRKAA